MPENIRICARCGKEFVADIDDYVCSNECAEAIVQEMNKKWRRPRSAKAGRLCHDCKQPVPDNNYRCAECWRKWRIKYQISDEAFHNSSSLLAHCDGF